MLVGKPLNAVPLNDSSVYSYPAAILRGDLADAFSMMDSGEARQRILLASEIFIADTALWKTLQRRLDLTSSFSLQDQSISILLARLQSSLAFADNISLAQFLQLLVSSFEVSDEISWKGIFKEVLEDWFRFTDEQIARTRISIEDAFSLADSLLERLKAVFELSSAMSFMDEALYEHSIAVLLEDEFAISDSLYWSLRKRLEITSRFELFGAVSFHGERYSLWGMNPKSMGVFRWSYAQKWNSMARIGGENYFCCEDGIYKLSGVTDDGEKIPAWLRTGLLDLGTEEIPGTGLKQLTNAYLIMTTEGRTLLKVLRTRDLEEAEEMWFECREKPKVPAKVRIPLSSSLRSVLFQFELKPLEGKPAKYVALDVIPIYLSKAI